MTITIHAQGAERKRLVQTISDWLGVPAKYQMAMALARSMRSKGLISAKEYAKIDTIIANKYGISSCSIFR